MSTDGVDQVVHISSGMGIPCPECRHQFLDGERFADAVNHVLAHGWVLLHMGTETSHDDEGRPWHNTVAVLGRRPE